MSRALDQMVATDADVALRRFDVTNPGAAEEHNIQTFPHVKVYNRAGSFVGIVFGLDVEKVKSYVAQAKWQLPREVTRHARAYANRSSTFTTILNCLESSSRFVATAS